MKKLGYSVLGILLIGIIWYLFLKPYDYTIRFKANTFSGAINQSLKLWNTRQKASEKIVQNGSIYDLTQHLKFNDSTYRYQWHIQPLTDTTSRVRVDIQDIDNSLMNKIKVPFSDTDFEKRSRKTVEEFIKKLNKHIKKFKVRIEGYDTINGSYCAYIPVKTKQSEKAMGMMRYFPDLVGFIKENNIKENGEPFLEITNWNQKTDSVSYNFCYPIVYSDSLPEHKEIKYENKDMVEGIKAVYNGNYITSDRAWYRLLDYAKKNNIDVIPKPIEFFYNNPHQGGNELEWKAEIFLPLRKNNNE